VVAGLAGVVAFVTISRAAAQGTSDAVAGPQTSVVVVSRSVSARSLLRAEDLAVKEMPIEAAPEGAMNDPSMAEGRLTMVDLYPGEVVLSQRLVDPNLTLADGQTALALREDQVLMALPADDLMSRIGLLQPGDLVDLLVSLEVPMDGGLALSPIPAEGAAEGGVDPDTEEDLATFCMLQGVEIVSLVAQESPQPSSLPATQEAEGVTDPEAILVALNPQDALILKYALDADGIKDVVLRAPGVNTQFDVEPVTVDYVINRYQIPTGVIR
jgi:pilus assembly protein CpaB